jgi:hypothetical protein
MAEFNYAKAKQKKNIDDTVAMLESMPGFIDYYFKANSMVLSSSSQRSYMYDIYNFLKWWHDVIPELKDTELKLKHQQPEKVLRKFQVKPSDLQLKQVRTVNFSAL